MINAISPLAGGNALYSSMLPAAQAAAAAGAKEEFLTIFYKELLKQAFKAPDLTLGGEEQSAESAFYLAFNSDMMVEQLAAKMARKSALDIGRTNDPTNNQTEEAIR